MSSDSIDPRDSVLEHAYGNFEDERLFKHSIFAMSVLENGTLNVKIF